MKLTIADLENKLLSLLQSYHDLGISIECIRKRFVAYKSTNEYLKRNKNIPNNKKIL